MFALEATISVYAQERILTTASVITEMVCALCDGEKIMASDRTTLYPAHIRQLPSIGYQRDINAQGIISLKPTLMIGTKEYVEGEVITQPSSSNIKPPMMNYVGPSNTIEEWTDRLDARHLLQQNAINKIQRRVVYPVEGIQNRLKR